VFDGEICGFFAADQLCVLEANGTIRRTADLAHWRVVASTRERRALPAMSRQLPVDLDGVSCHGGRKVR
jgi:hypothetical protein